MMSMSEFEKLSLDEQDRYLAEMSKNISYKTRKKAWDKMDDGIYDSKGYLIGEKHWNEDAYLGDLP